MAKARRSVKMCVDAIREEVEAGRMSEAAAKRLLRRIDNMAEALIRDKGYSVDRALREIQGTLLLEEATKVRIDKRNRLLTERAKRGVKEYVKKFPDQGKGLLAYLEGSNRDVVGGRYSVDYRARAAHQQYFGRLAADLEARGVWRDFKQGKHELDVYRELEAMSKESFEMTGPITGNRAAREIAEAIHGVRREMIARQNMAGAYISREAEFTIGQMHDTTEIRNLGKREDGTFDQRESFRRWYEFLLPRLDHHKTFKGNDPKEFLWELHKNLYHGKRADPAAAPEVDVFSIHGTLARKASMAEVLKFKGADEAYQYNQAFGLKHLRDAVTSDMHFRTRNIAMMEAFGPSPRSTFDGIIRELKEEAMESADPRAVKALENEWLDRSFREVSGESEIPHNVTSAKVWSGIRIVTQMAKMGGTVISALADKAFMHAELTWQGVSRMEALSAQVVGLRARTPEEKRRLRLMGVAMDGLMGAVASRWSVHSTVSGGLHRAQQRYFDINFLNWWTDTHKAASAEVMSAHLGEHANLDFRDLPVDLQRVLRQYDIQDIEWSLLRHAVEEIGDTGSKFMTPDLVKKIPRDEIGDLVRSRGLKDTEPNRTRAKQDLENRLRTYLVDRADIAVPTAGAGERKFSTFGLSTGTVLGETLRTLMLFKSFPITVVRKILGREVMGRGATGVRDWLMHDHMGKFRIAQLIAMTTIGGYLSGAIKDALKGREPRPLVRDGNLNWAAINDAMIRGGGAGIMGDFLFSEFDRQYRSFLGTAAGPVFGQLDPLANMFSKAKKGRNIAGDLRKFTLENVPFVNLFYVRPVLDYFVLWNIQEMLDPGSLEQTRKNITKKTGQEFFVPLPD